MKSYLLTDGEEEYNIEYKDIEDLKNIADIVVDEICSFIGGYDYIDVIDQLRDYYNREVSEEDEFNNSYLIIADGIGDPTEYYIEVIDEDDMMSLLDDLVHIALENSSVDELISLIKDAGYEIVIK